MKCKELGIYLCFLQDRGLKQLNKWPIVYFTTFFFFRWRMSVKGYWGMCYWQGWQSHWHLTGHASTNSQARYSPPHVLLCRPPRLLSHLGDYPRKSHDPGNNHCSILNGRLCWLLLTNNMGCLQEYTNSKGEVGRFKDSQFLVFVNRILAFSLSGSYILLRRQPRHSMPLYKYAYCSFSNIMSSWCQYEALKFVSFPTQVG